MPTLTDYTNYAEIRAALGVSDDEIKDDTLALDLYTFHLDAELRDIHANIPSQFATVSAIAETSRTDVQKQFFQTARVFATYVVAKQLTSALPLFGPKDISDSKTLVSRFSDSPYKETIKRVESMYDLNRSRLSTAFAILSSTSSSTTQRTLFAISSPNVDRVVE